MAFRLNTSIEGQAGETFDYGIARRATAAAKARIDAAVAEFTVEVGREVWADITSAGNFGSRWTDGFTITVTHDQNETDIVAAMAVPYWRVFEEGRVIQGKPLLWFAPTAGILLQGSKPGDPLPEVISVKQVVIPKKFHITEIMAKAVEQLRQLLSRSGRYG